MNDKQLARAVEVVADYLEQRHDYGGYIGATAQLVRDDAEHEAAEIMLTLKNARVLCDTD